MEQDPQLAAVLKELSDIKTNLAVNTNETTNIKGNVSEIKLDIKTIRQSFVTHEEFDTKFGEIKDSIKPLRSFVYGIIAVMGVAVLGAVLQLVLRKSQ